MTLLEQRIALRDRGLHTALRGEQPISEAAAIARATDSAPTVTVCSWCSWCPDSIDQTAAARAHGFEVSHDICPACQMLFEAGATGR